MHFKSILALALFATSIVLTNAAVAPPSSFSWSHGYVVSGGSVTITVDAAPCHPVEVVLTINGEEVTGQIAAIPGSVDLRVPVDTVGEGYTITIKCPTERASRTGQVM